MPDVLTHPTHTCPAPGCQVPVSFDQLACSRHWYSIPKTLRDELWRAYKGEGQGSERHSAAVEACIAFLERAAGS